MPWPGHLYVQDQNNRAQGVGTMAPAEQHGHVSAGGWQGGDKHQDHTAEGAHCTGYGGPSSTGFSWLAQHCPPCLCTQGCSEVISLPDVAGFLLESKKQVPVVRVPCQILFHARKEEKLLMINCAIGESTISLTCSLPVAGLFSQVMPNMQLGRRWGAHPQGMLPVQTA